MADNEEKTRQDEEETAGFGKGKAAHDIKSSLKGKIKTIILISAMLAVNVLAALATIITELDGNIASKSGFSIFLGALTLIGWLGITAAAVIKKNRTQSQLLLIIFVISFIGFIALLLSGAGTGSEEAAQFFGVLALPYFAMLPLFQAAGLSSAGLTALIYIIIIAVNTWNFFRLLVSKSSKRGDSALDYVLGFFGGSEGEEKEGKDGRGDKW